MNTLLNLSSISRRLRNRAIDAKAQNQPLIAVVALVDNQSYSIRLREKPAVGATVDVGFPVRVLEAKDVAGGGVLVVAEKVNEDSVLGAPR